MARKQKAPPTLKPAPAPADEATISDELREGQKAYLLLQLLDADNQTLSRGEANKFRDLRKPAKISLNFLKAAVANYRRERLAELNLIKITPGRAVQYTLLADGRDYLATCVRHLADVEFAIKGKTLNALITAAQESSFQAERPSVAPPTEQRASAAPAPAAAESLRSLITSGELERGVLAVFEDLRRERHGHSGMVPIHEVRRRIAEQFGAEAARHEILDEAILNLWRDKRLGLEGISDLSSATEQQLNDSIPGEGNTIFYLEVPRDQPILA